MLVRLLIFIAILFPGILYADEIIHRFNSLSEIFDLHQQKFFSWDHFQYLFNIVLAGLLGYMIGWGHQKPRVNVRATTFASVAIATSLGGCLILHLNHFYHVNVFSSVSGFVTGTGFIAGAIILKDGVTGVYGLTSAAVLWATSIIGITAGLEFYLLAVFSAIVISFFLRISRNYDE
ncbi:MAG: MgtC/SapB family protein [bacterium]|nr:MgtC/SapB family protein [bacterium]